jgi:hypothetical protein
LTRQYALDDSLILSGVRPDLGRLSASRTVAIGNRAKSADRVIGTELAVVARHACSSTTVPAGPRGLPVPFTAAASLRAAQATLRSVRGGLQVVAIGARSASRSRRGGGIMNIVDMSTPVTRGELREELALLEQKIEQKLEQKLEQKFDQKLELWGGALLARITESDQRAKESEQRLLARITESEQRAIESEQRALARATESEQRMLTEIARHIRAANEAMIAQLSVIDEKYTDLPGRVRRLETKVFAAKRR